MSAAEPERPEKVPLLEERSGATGTYKTRHSTSSPGDRRHPGKRNNEKQSILEKQIALRVVNNQQHSRNAGKEQKPKNRRPAIQITPGRLERRTGAHGLSCYFLKVTPAKLRKSARQLVAVHGICAIGPLALLPHFPIHLTAGKSGEILTGRLQKQVV